MISLEEPRALDHDRRMIASLDGSTKLMKLIQPLIFGFSAEFETEVAFYKVCC